VIDSEYECNSARKVRHDATSVTTDADGNASFNVVIAAESEKGTQLISWRTRWEMSCVPFLPSPFPSQKLNLISHGFSSPGVQKSCEAPNLLSD
jgi:hypothetical protein